MTHVLDQIDRALAMAAGMFWQTGWSLVLGFAVSGLLQAIVPADQMRRALGRAGPREIAIATLAGAASSSCSYTSAAITRAHDRDPLMIVGASRKCLNERPLLGSAQGPLDVHK